MVCKHLPWKGAMVYIAFCLCLFFLDKKGFEYKLQVRPCLRHSLSQGLAPYQYFLPFYKYQ